MQQPDDQETRDLEIADVVAKWMELPVRNRPSPDELASLHPELAPGLEECLRGLQLIQGGKVEGLPDAESKEFEDIESHFPEIPDFEIECELGRGGMGVVYQARQASLDRMVALKVLPIGSVDSRSVQRFQREAETVANLSHPGIVPVYSVGVHNGLHWFAMQKIDGCPSSQWFAETTFESRTAANYEVVRVGIEVAEALDHAHRRGVIHRDVKPGNLLVEKTGKVWLTDFGLARRDVDVTATATGALLGTPRYMSAEQIFNSDEKIDGRTDVYSLGATLYEMATGRPVFGSQSPLELLTQIQRDEPTPPRQIDPAISRTLELVILKCLDKEPHRRYLSAAALAEDLKAVRDHQPITAKGLPVWIKASRFIKRNQRQFDAIASSIALTLLTLAALALLWRENQQSKLGKVQIISPAGLYVANIQQKPIQPERQGTTAQSRPIETSGVAVTTPIQQPITLLAGEYLVRMEGHGRPSQTFDLQLGSEDTVEMKYVDRREALPEVDIYRKLAVPLVDNALAVLGQDAFEVLDAGGARRFTLQTALLADGLDDSAIGKEAVQDDPPLSFGFNHEQAFQGDFNVPHSGFARIERISSTNVDLNADGKPDVLLAAERHAAIAAVSHDGTILWKRRLKMKFEDPTSLSTYPKKQMPNEAIVGITPIRDLNDDGVVDLVVNAALFDPSGFSRPAIFTLSGRDGSEIAVTDFPTTNMQTVKDWPWSGLLRHRRSVNVDDRETRMINHSFFPKPSDLSNRPQNLDEDFLLPWRSGSKILSNMVWGGNSDDSALYVLPRLVMGDHDGQPIAATVIARSIHFLDVTNGKAVGSPTALVDPINRGPTKVRLSDGKLGVVVMTGVPGTEWTKCHIHLCVSGESKPRWSVAQYTNAVDLVAGAAESSFPMAVDLDEDGEDEILSTTNNLDGLFKTLNLPKMHCFSANGTLRWSTEGIAGISSLADRAISIGDIDNDRIADLAVIGISAQRVPHESGEWEGLRLVVDFVSGRTGQRLGYRQERITGESKTFDVVEIDSVERIGNELVCSVVYGSKQELKLSSATVTMELQQLAPSTIANGLTSFDGRWHRRRSGEYANPADTAVWIAPRAPQSQYGNEMLIGTWNSPEGEPRVLLSGTQSVRCINPMSGLLSGTQSVRCINPMSGLTLWRRDKFEFEWNYVFVIPATNGQTDLLVSKSNFYEAEPAFLDAETGQMQFQIHSPDMGIIKKIELDPIIPDRYVYAFARAEFHKSGQIPSWTQQGFLLSKIDRQEKRLVWSKPYYNTLKYNFYQPSRLFHVDVNNDGVSDVITGNIGDAYEVVEALDGRNGNTIWSSQLALKSAENELPQYTPWPMLTVVSNGNKKYLVVIDSVAGDNRSIELKCVDLLGGNIVSRLKLPIQMDLKIVIQNKSLSLHVLAPTKRDGLLGLRTFQRKRGQEVWSVIRVEQDGNFTEVDQFGAFPSTLASDIDGDETLDLIHVQGRSVEIHRGDTNDLINSFEIPEELMVRGIERIGDKSHLVAYRPYQQGHIWFELPSGKVAVRSSHGLQEIQQQNIHYPRLLPHASGTLLVGSTPEALTCIAVDFGESIQQVQPTRKLAVAMHSPSTDHRKREAAKLLGIYVGRNLEDAIWLAVLATGAILIPVFYVVQLVRNRQWSLRQVLFGFVVTMVAIFAWRSPSLEIGAGLFIASSILSVAYLLRHLKWKLLAVGIVLSMLYGTIMMATGAGTLTEGSVGYWTFNEWLRASAWSVSQCIPPLAWGDWSVGNLYPKYLKRASQIP